MLDIRINSTVEYHLYGVRHSGSTLFDMNIAKRRGSAFGFNLVRHEHREETMFDSRINPTVDYLLYDVRHLGSTLF